MLGNDRRNLIAIIAVLAAIFSLCFFVLLAVGYWRQRVVIDESDKLDSAMFTVLRKLSGGELSELACPEWAGQPRTSRWDWWIDLYGIPVHRALEPLHPLPPGTRFIAMLSDAEMFDGGSAGSYRLHVSGTGRVGVQQLRGLSQVALGQETFRARDLYTMYGLTLVRDAAHVTNLPWVRVPWDVRAIEASSYTVVRIARERGQGSPRWCAFDPVPAAQVHFFSEGTWYCSVAFYRGGMPTGANLVHLGEGGKVLRRVPSLGGEVKK